MDQIAIVVPFGDHSNASDYTAAVGEYFARCRRNVVPSAGSHGLDGDHNRLFRLFADALDFLIDLLGSSNPASRCIYVQDDGFDRVVICEFLELGNYRLWLDDHAFKVHDADFVPESPK